MSKCHIVGNHMSRLIYYRHKLLCICDKHQNFVCWFMYTDGADGETNIRSFESSSASQSESRSGVQESKKTT